LITQRKNGPALGSTLQVPLLYEVRFVHLFKRLGLFTNGNGKGLIITPVAHNQIAQRLEMRYNRKLCMRL